MVYCILMALAVIWRAIGLYRDYRRLKSPVPNQWKADIDWGDIKAVREEVRAALTDDEA